MSEGAIAIWKKWTAGVILAALASLVVWDLVVVTAAPDPPGLDNATESRWILDTLTNLPGVALDCGILLGHWLWPVYVYEIKPWLRNILLVLVMVAAPIGDVFQFIPDMIPLIPVAIGVPLGHYLWPQRVRI